MKVEQNKDLKDLNTFGISATAKEFVSVTTVEELKAALSDRDEVFPLGGGSNMLLTQNIDSCVIKNNIKGFEVMSDSDSEVEVRVGGGESWHDFVMWCVERGYGGVENLALIPGSVGACPIQNIGAYGVEVKDVISTVEVVELEAGETKVFTNEDCGFGYRNSIFKTTAKGKYFITHVNFILSTAPDYTPNISYRGLSSYLKDKSIKTPNMQQIADAVIDIRQSKLPDPKVIGNSGSFFKNPVVDKDILKNIESEYENIPYFELESGEYKIPAAWLIQTAGLKGFRDGDAGCHVDQPLVLVNYGSATGEQLLELADKIIIEIKNKFGIELEKEVNII